MPIFSYKWQLHMHCIGLFYRCPALYTHIPFNNHSKISIFIYILTFVSWHFAGKYCAQKKKTTSRLNIYSVTLSSFFFCTLWLSRAFWFGCGKCVLHERGRGPCRSFYMFSFIIKFILIVILFGTINRWAIYRVQTVWHIQVSSCFVFI